jgi:hypothetical protein
MSAKRGFETQIAALDALRERPEAERIESLRAALKARNNFVVSRAADLARDFGLPQLTPELLAAFDRFFEDPGKDDPQCWAKNAISRALAAFEHQDPEVFLRGMRHIQMEPVWGGQSDTAGTLRATCALALVQCRSLSENTILSHLIELLADADKAVRADVVRAIGQFDSPSAALLLRLRATVGSDEPEVLGACYAGVLSIEGTGAIPWVARFLAAADDSAAEAALALAGTHSLEGFEALRDRMEKTSRKNTTNLKKSLELRRPIDPWFQSVLLSAVALTRQDAAVEFLLHLVSSDSSSAEGAIEALMRSAPSVEVIGRLERMVEINPRLAQAFAVHRKSDQG